MSRSYKKNPVVTDNKGSKYNKRQANQRFRRQINLDDDMPARLDIRSIRKAGTYAITSLE